MNFVFYDTEATGPRPGHDQMLAFAAVLADDGLVEQDRFSLRCRMRPHHLPAAEALLLTGWSLGDILDRTLPSFREMVEGLQRRLLAWKPAMFAGYSSLEFDEPLLAASLRHCRLPPDITAPARIDIQRLALGLHSFQPGAIASQPRFDGQPSFRLGDVARANAISPGKAHDAMGDVLTTLAVARLMRDRAPIFWKHMLQMADPDRAAHFVFDEPVRLYCEFHHNRPHHWLVTPVARAGDRVIVFDLAHEPADAAGMSDDALRQWLRRHPHPMRAIALRDCPFILPRSAAVGLVALAPGVADRRAALIAADAAFRARLVAAHAALDPPDAPAEEGGQVQRLRYEEDPAALDAEVRKEIEADIAARMLADSSSPWRTLDRAFDEADAALEGATDQEALRIGELLDYLRSELSWARARSADQNRSNAKR